MKMINFDLLWRQIWSKMNHLEEQSGSFIGSPSVKCGHIERARGICYQKPIMDFDVGHIQTDYGDSPTLIEFHSKFSES